MRGMKGILSCCLEGEVPEVIRVLPLGEVTLADGRDPFFVTRESLRQVLAAWRRRGHDVVIDYEHQSLQGQEAPAAGWLKELWIEKDGLYARVAWTERARRYLEQQEYRYFSPVVQLNEAREVTDLLQVALTNCPAISHLEPLMLRKAWPKAEEDRPREEVGESKALGSGALSSEEARNTGGVMLEKLRTIFGLADEAGESEVMAMAMDLMRQRQEENREVLTEICTLMGLEPQSNGAEIGRRVQALVQEVEACRQAMAALKEERRTERAERLIQEALNSRKTTPAELDQANGRLRRLAKDDPEFFQELILSRREHWAVPGPLFANTQNQPVLRPEEVWLCEVFGLQPEVYWQQKKQVEVGE